MGHYDDANTLLHMSDQAALEGMSADADIQLAKAAKSIAYILAGQTHAMLAIVDELRALRTELHAHVDI